MHVERRVAVIVCQIQLRDISQPISGVRYQCANCPAPQLGYNLVNKCLFLSPFDSVAQPCQPPVFNMWRSVLWGAQPSACFLQTLSTCASANQIKPSIYPVRALTAFDLQLYVQVLFERYKMPAGPTAAAYDSRDPTGGLSSDSVELQTTDDVQPRLPPLSNPSCSCVRSMLHHNYTRSVVPLRALWKGSV